MRLLHFVEEQCSASVRCKGSFEHSGFRPGTSEQKTHRGLILELRHIKTVEMIRAAKVFGEGDSDFSFADSGWTDEKERTFRTLRMSQVQFSSLEHGADARKNMVLSLDVGFKVSLQVTELGEKI